MLTCSGGKLDLETAELSCFYLCRTSTVLYDNKLNITRITTLTDFYAFHRLLQPLSSIGYEPGIALISGLILSPSAGLISLLLLLLFFARRRLGPTM